MAGQKMLKLMTTDFVMSYHSNTLWSECVTKLQNMETIREDIVGLEHAILENGKRCYYPVLTRSLESGNYHLNIQKSAFMFVGFMTVTEKEICWWNSNDGDGLTIGYAGSSDDFNDSFSKQLVDKIPSKVNLTTYTDTQPEWINPIDVLTPFI